jgi:uncharacterized protein YhdP
VDGIVEIGGTLPAPTLVRAELRAGGGPVTLPEQAGIRLVGGLERFSLDEWRAALTARDVAPSAREAGQPLAWLHSAALDFGTLEVFGQQIHSARVQLTRQPAGYLATLDSREIKGRVQVPQSLARDPIEADLDYLFVAESHVSGAAHVDPRDLPALRVRAKDFRYDPRRFGALTLDTAKVTNGLRFDQLVVKPEATQVVAQGGWYVDGAQHTSRLQFNLTSSNIGKSLQALGYSGAIRDGTGTAKLDVSWPGPLLQVDTAHLKGSVSLHAENGRLLELDPGGGRVFGLLSLQTLPRRLTLDFSDVFAKGFSFDQINGNFVIDAGEAYTNDLFLEGPAAHIDVAGRAGLAAQDYDQIVTVTPKYGSTLPLLGALAAPPLGVTLFFLQQVFEKQIDKVGQYKYTVTGPWDKPNVQGVVREPIATERDGP